MFSGVKGRGSGKAEKRGIDSDLGLAAYLHSKVETEKAEPRRKLPGGQSSPQSLRGIASIVEPMGERMGKLFWRIGIHCEWLYLLPPGNGAIARNRR